MHHRWLTITGVLGAVGVSLGAFGAHGLRAILPLQRMTIFETAVRYHFYHVLALFGIAMCMAVFPERAPGLRTSARLMLTGVVMFSGSLYALAVSDLTFLRLVTPLGGLCWVAGWITLAWAFRGEAPPQT